MLNTCIIRVDVGRLSLASSAEGTVTIQSCHIWTAGTSAAPPAGFGRSFGSDATLASLTFGGLLGLSGLLHRGFGSRRWSGLLGGAVWRGRLDLWRGGCCHHLLLDDLLLDYLRCCPSGNHLNLSRSGCGCLGQSHGLSLDLRRTGQTSVLFANRCSLMTVSGHANSSATLKLNT